VRVIVYVVFDFTITPIRRVLVATHINDCSVG
jgi:hypothetical protein